MKIKYYQHSLAVMLTALCLNILSKSAQADDVSQLYRFTVFPYYKITTNLTIYAQLGYAINPDKESQLYNLISPGLYYKFTPEVELWGGLNNRYIQNDDAPNAFLLRPFIGPKLFLPNRWKWNLYNFTQYEFRATENLDTHDWSYDNRIRSRFEADAPLTSTAHAWQPQTFYSITSIEPFYDINHNDIIQLRVAGGFGYVISKYTQMEFIYYAQFGRINGGPFQYNENIFRLNLKIGLNRKNDAKEAAAISSQ